MPELSLNQDKDILFVSGQPGVTRADEIHIDSQEAGIIIEKVAEERGETSEKILYELLKGGVVEF